MKEYTQTLKLVGIALIGLGLLDIAIMIYCIANKVSYSSSFNILAVIAGIFLLTGNLRAARIVAWILAFSVIIFFCLPFLFLLISPLELYLLQIKLNPAYFITSLVLWLVVLALFYCLLKGLRRKSVLEACALSGKPMHSVYTPIIIAICLIIAFAIGIPIMRNSEVAHLAKAKAGEQYGEGYKYVVNNIHFNYSKQGKNVTAMITAYNDHEIRVVPVKWSEK